VPDDQTTRPSLLLRIRDARDLQAWKQFAEIYAPLIHRFAGRNGLQAADASDLTQEVMSAVAKSIGKFEYDPQVGRFRSWLFKVARNQMNAQYHRQRKQPRGSGDSGVQQILASQTLDDGELQRLWDEEYEQRLFDWAAEKVRGQFTGPTWQAFWQTAVENRPVSEVAADLELTVGAVYIAKSRVLARLKEQIEQVDDR